MANYMAPVPFTYEIRGQGSIELHKTSSSRGAA